MIKNYSEFILENVQKSIISQASKKTKVTIKYFKEI